MAVSPVSYPAPAVARPWRMVWRSALDDLGRLPRHALPGDRRNGGLGQSPAADARPAAGRAGRRVRRQRAGVQSPQRLRLISSGRPARLREGMGNLPGNL